MAKVSDGITINATIARIYLVFFPIAVYKRVGDVIILRILGIPVYRRVGAVIALRILGVPIYRRAGDRQNILGFNRIRTHAA